MRRLLKRISRANQLILVVRRSHETETEGIPGALSCKGVGGFGVGSVVSERKPRGTVQLSWTK